MHASNNRRNNRRVLEYLFRYVLLNGRIIFLIDADGCFIFVSGFGVRINSIYEDVRLFRLNLISVMIIMPRIPPDKNTPDFLNQSENFLFIPPV